MPEKLSDQTLSINHQLHHSRASSLTRESPSNTSISLPASAREVTRGTIPSRQSSAAPQSLNQEMTIKSSLTASNDMALKDGQSGIFDTSNITTPETKNGSSKPGPVSQQRHYVPQEVNVSMSHKIPGGTYPIKTGPLASFVDGNERSPESNSISKIRDPRLNRRKEQTVDSEKNDFLQWLVIANILIGNYGLQSTEMPPPFGVGSSLARNGLSGMIETTNPWGESPRFGQHALPTFRSGRNVNNQNPKWGEPFMNQSKHVTHPNPVIGQKTKDTVVKDEVSDVGTSKENPVIDLTKDEDSNTLSDLRQRVKIAAQKGDYETADKLIRIHQFLAPGSPIKSGRPQIEMTPSSPKPSISETLIIPGPTQQHGGLSFATGVTASLEVVGLTPHFHELFKKLSGRLPLTIFNKNWLELAHSYLASQPKKTDKNGNPIFKGFPYESEWSMSFSDWESHLNYMITLAREMYNFEPFANGLAIHRETVKDIAKEHGWPTAFRYCQKVRHSVFTFKVGPEGKDTQDIGVWRKDLEEVARQESEAAGDLNFHDNPYRRGGEKEGYDPSTGKPRPNQLKPAHRATVRASSYAQSSQDGSAGKVKRQNLYDLGTIRKPDTLNYTCLPPELNVETWQRLSLDDFIRKFPNSQQISVQNFMASHGSNNFLCGIGEHCNAGQLCSPIVSVEAWMVGFAIQQYNNYMNNCFDAIGYSMSSTSSVVSSMVVDLFEDLGISKMLINFRSIKHDVLSTALLAFFTGIAYTSGMYWGSVFGAIPLMGFFFVITSTVDSFTQELVEQDFTTWSELSYQLTRIQEGLQTGLDQYLKTSLQTGMSSQTGILNVINGGIFVQEDSTPSPSELEKRMNRRLQAKMLNRIMRANNMYITRASDPCTFSGVAGARTGSNIMSYCDKDGTLWEIVRAHGKKVKHEIHNADLISNRYGFSLETIVTTSWSCQTKYSEFEHELFNSTSFTNQSTSVTESDQLDNLNPSTFNNFTSLDECLFNLPVCDCASPEINLARAIKRHQTTKICREIGRLPI
ncbi:hypothetical protein DFH28DRAFT_1084267 [Melampsora americana]|nr:hypothetical protein DFH28DRAFT_1084267 [Melampsora americana]